MNATNPFLFVEKKARNVEIPELEGLRAMFKVSPASFVRQMLYQRDVTFEIPRVLYLLCVENEVEFPLVDRSIATFAELLEPEIALNVFLLLKKNRVNNKRVRRAILNYLWNSPILFSLCVEKGGILRSLIEHALGVNTTRGLVKELLDSPTEGRKCEILSRFSNKARHHDSILNALGILYGRGTNARVRIRRDSEVFQSAECVFEEAAPILDGDWAEVEMEKLAEAASSHRKVFEEKSREALSQNRGRFRMETTSEQGVSLMSRGDIAAALTRIYQGSELLELAQEVEKCADKVASEIPPFPGKVALVLDMSLSMRSYGSREFAYASQAFAFALVLKRVCKELAIIQVGGTQETYPKPMGVTDLASAYIRALQSEPDLVVIVSDGYENSQDGDLELALSIVPEECAGIKTAFCHSMYSEFDKLEFRRPVSGLPEFRFWHEDDFPLVCSSLFSLVSGAEGTLKREQEKVDLIFLDGVLSL
ncbi:MAG: hypothetical protein Q4D38_01135 [Planctomycetia bacterium]|nr:hypothetical protein [Planctomycetia bacterium]